MGISKKTKAVLFGLVYGSNLLSAFFLWLCGVYGNIMLGILLIVFYRLSLWTAPLSLTVICWLPSKVYVFILFYIIFCICFCAVCFFVFVIFCLEIGIDDLFCCGAKY